MGVYTLQQYLHEEQPGMHLLVSYTDYCTILSMGNNINSLSQDLNLLLEVVSQLSERTESRVNFGL